jgi:hypothetical protein
VTNPASQIAAQNAPLRELTTLPHFSNLAHGKEIFRAIRGARHLCRFNISSQAHVEAG